MQQMFLKTDVCTFFGRTLAYCSSASSRSQDGEKQKINWCRLIYVSGEIIINIILLLGIPPRLTHHSLFMHILAFSRWPVPLCYRYPMALWEAADHIGNSMPSLPQWPVTKFLHHQDRQLLLDAGTCCVTTDGSDPEGLQPLLSTQ